MTSPDTVSEPAPLIGPVEFDVHITRELLRKVAARRFLRRWPLLLVSVLLILPSTFLGFREGEWPPSRVIGLTVLAFFALTWTIAWIRQSRIINSWLSMQGDAPVRYALDSQGVSASSNLGKTELRWPVFTSLTEHPQYLLLHFAGNSHLTLPRQEVPEPALLFLRDRIPSKKPR